MNAKWTQGERKVNAKHQNIMEISILTSI
jgi:hypothetical protein